MRMRSRWRLSVVLILASTSVATWLLVNRESGATAGTAAATGPVTGTVKPAAVSTTEATTAPAAQASPTPPPPGDTTAVKRGSLNLAFDLDGVFEPVEPFELRLKVRSYQGDFIVTKSVEPGTKVAKGDVLLELDPQKIDVQIAAAENELTADQANLAKADSDVKLGDASDALAMNTARAELGFARTELKRWDATDGPANLLAGNMEVKQVQAQLDDAVDELNELKKMYKSEDLTNETADIVMKRAARGVELTKVSQQIAKANADRATTYAPVVTREHLADAVEEKNQSVAQLEAAQSQAKVTRSTTLVAAKQAADEAARKLAELKQDRSNFSITSPVDGIAVYGSFAHKAWQELDRDKLAVDAKVPADTVLLTVFTPGKLRVRAEWPETEIALLAPGAKAAITPVAIPELNYVGTVGHAAFVGAAKGDGQEFDVPIDIPAADPRLEPGYKAAVSIDAGKLDHVLLLPNTAISHGKVWVHQAGGDDVAKPVTIGRSDGKQTEIKDGLADGDAVLTQAKH